MVVVENADAIGIVKNVSAVTSDVDFVAVAVVVAAGVTSANVPGAVHDDVIATVDNVVAFVEDPDNVVCSAYKIVVTE